MSSGKVVKAKNNKYYKPSFRKNPPHNIDVNFRGFLCSCNSRVKDCIRESYTILNKAADELYGSNEPEQKNEETDISDDLSKELDSLKSENVDKKFRFKVCDSGAKNLIFVRTSLEDPVKISLHIAENIYKTKQQQTKFLLRLVPIEITCKAHLNDMVKAFEPLAVKYFQNEGRTFSIVYNHRNNNSFNSKDELFKLIAEKVCSVNKDNKVNLKGADVSIVIEIIRGFAFIGVVPHFLKYKKYNLLALSDKEEEKKEELTEEAKTVEKQETVKEGQDGVAQSVEEDQKEAESVE